MKTLVAALALLAAGCQPEVVSIPYQGLTISLWGPDEALVESGSAADPFAASKTFEVTLDFFEDAEGTKPYADEATGLPAKFVSYEPQVVFSGPGTREVIAPAEDLILPRLSEDQSEIYVQAVVRGLDTNRIMARARCPVVKLGNRKKDASLPEKVTCKAFFGLVGRWNPVARPATNRRQFAAAALPDGRVVIAGGIDAASQNNSPVSSVELFDPAANGGKGGWTAQKSLGGDARFGLTATVTAGGSVMFIGGRTQGGFSQNVDLYDVAQKSMRAVKALTEKRGGHGAGLVDGERVLAIGGFSAADVPNGAADLVTPSAQVQQTISTGVPAGRVTPCVAQVKPNQVLVIGGSATEKKLVQFNGTQFDTLTQELRVARPAPKCAVVNEQVFVFGGANDALAGSIEVFKNGTLSPRTDFKPLRDHAVAMSGGRIVVAGGYLGTDASQAPLKSSWFVKPETAQVVPDPGTAPIDMRWARKEHELVGLPDNTVMAIGGWAPANAAPGDVPGAEIFVVPEN